MVRFHFVGAKHLRRINGKWFSTTSPAYLSQASEEGMKKPSARPVNRVPKEQL